MIERCLIEGSSRLDASAVARHLWYSTQIEGAPSPKFRVSSLIIAVGLDFQLVFDEIINHGVPDK